MEAFGLKLVGQGYMIRGYSLGNHKEFFGFLKREVDFVKNHKNRESINIIDVGANLGFHSVVYALMDNTNIISFEPFPDNYKDLDENIKTNNIKNILPLEIGLFSKNADMKIGNPTAFSYRGFLNRILKHTDKKQAGCKSVYTSDKRASISKFIKGDDCKYISGKKHIDLIKIDVEGAEMDVIIGLNDTINKHHPVLKIEFHPYALMAANRNNFSIWRHLINVGYKYYAIAPCESDLKNWLSMETMPKISGCKDILFID